MVTVQKLKSSNLAIHVNSPIVKKDLEAETGWVISIAPGVIVYKRTWPVLVHGVRVADY